MSIRREGVREGGGEGGGRVECVLVRLLRTKGWMKGRQGVEASGRSALKYEPGRLGGGTRVVIVL
jgi:hypothetical protein